jgi:hypothetical protein
MSLYIPELTPGATVLEAAWAYAAAGWFVGPASVQTKHPGSLLGKGWDEQTSRDPAVIHAWFTRWPEAGLFLHLGKSGATGIDVDHPEKLGQMHPDFARAVYTYAGPVQTTRAGLRPVPDHSLGTGGSAQRSHLLFLTPPGRRISNSNGDTGKGWGEVRGENGVFIVAPSEHTKVDGRYLWERTGWVHPMPSGLAALLKDASAKVDAATRDRLLQVRSQATGSQDAGLFARGPLAHYNSLIERGAHRHESLVEVLPWVMREALAGLYPLAWAEDQIRALHLAACADPGRGSGAVRLEDEAGAEFDDVAAWALGHAQRADARAVVKAVKDRVDPDLSFTPAALPVPPAWSYPFGDPDTGPAARFPVSTPVGITTINGTVRTLSVTTADGIRMKAQRWLMWETENGLNARWIPLGGIVLLAGREGLGKSTQAAKIGAAITRGTLPGQFYGTPKSVIVAAGEDAWEQTIVPRFVAHGADMSRVLRVDVTTSDGQAQQLELPADNRALYQACQIYDVALIILDPLMTVVGAKLDTHKDADVRRALGPLRDMAEAAQVTVLGLIHVSKSKDEDLLTRVMASRAFTAVARAVLFCARQASEQDDSEDQDDGPETYLFGQIKNNLGPKVRHTAQYQIETQKVGFDTELGMDIETSRIVEVGVREERINEIVTGQEGGRKRTAPKTAAAGEWLVSLIKENGPQTWPQVEAANGGQYSQAIVYAAKKQKGIESQVQEGATVWVLPAPYVTP